MSSRGTVLITGAAGSIGATFVRALGDQGWRRRCLVHRRAVVEADETVTGDLSIPTSLHEAVEGADVIVHLAALTHSRSLARYREVNVVGTMNLLAAARLGDVGRFVFVSTRAISPEGGAYSCSKARAEEAVRDGGVPWTIVRLPEVYGTGGAEGVDRILKSVRTGAVVPIVGRGDDRLCPAHIDDVVTACVRTMESSEAIGRTYTLAGPSVTVLEFVELAGKALGRRPRVLKVPTLVVAALAAVSRVLPLPIYPDQLTRLRSPKPAATPGAQVDLMFYPRPLSDGLKEVAARPGDGIGARRALV